MVYIFGRGLEYYKMACNDEKHDATFIDIPRGQHFSLILQTIKSIYATSKVDDIFVFYHTVFFTLDPKQSYWGRKQHRHAKKIKKFIKTITNKKVLYFHDEEWVVRLLHIEHNEHNSKKWKCVDKIATYDKNMAVLHNWPYIKYSIEDIRTTTNINSKKKKYDISIIQGYDAYNGQANKRMNDTYYFLHKLNAYKVNYLFGFRAGEKDILKRQGANEEQIKQTNYLALQNNYSPTNNFLQEFKYKIVNTKCCCFMSGGNAYITGKIQMAVLLNQKIITDLEEIKNTPFYDKKWVKVVDFTKVPDEIIKWLKDDKIKPNYKHKEYCLGGEFAKEIKKLF
ncbi:MAG: hypothetical protein LBV48_01120 [Mycoplasmataceae bacterium]|nr:hypothetical protein [Mycoplasmataceae bacterium]